MNFSVSLRKNIRIASVSVLTGTAAVFFFTALFSLISLAADMSDRACSTVSHISLFSGSMVSGTVNAFFSRRKGWIRGMEGGAGVMLLLAAAGSFFGSDMSASGMISGLALSLAAGTSGGIIGVNIKMNDKKYKLVNWFLYNA